MIKNRGLAILLLVLLIFTSHIKAIDAKETILAEMIDMFDVVKEKDLQVETWKITLREQVSKNELENVMQAIAYTGFSANYTTEKTNHATKYSWDVLKTNTNNESISMVVANKQDTIDVIYSIESKEIARFDRKSIENRIYQLKQTIFSDDVTKFTCITTEVDDMIDSVYFFNELRHLLHVEEVHNIHEQDFIVLSGYTELWGAAIPSLENEMNVQLAARRGLNGKITLTLGTPILTTEY